MWDAAEGVIRWVDMVAGIVHRLDPAAVDGAGTGAAGLIRTGAGTDETRVGDWVAALRPRIGGGWVVATRDGFLLTDEALHPEREIRAFEDDVLRMNEGGCTADGAFLCGTAGPAGTGFLYRLDPSGEASVLSGGITVSNGIAADPLGDGMLYVDTATRRIDRLRIDGGALVERAPFADLSGQEGLPDGIATDIEGGVWVAMWGGGAVIRFDAAGRPDDRIELPTPQVTACAFGGAQRDELYITTSQQGLATPDARAGALFRAHPGIRGAVEPSFGG